MALSLEDVVILEAASAIAAPMAGRLLADWGANVIHIEHPTRGDPIRKQRERPDDRVRGRAIISPIDYGWQNFNRNKRCLTLDLYQEGGRDIIHELLRRADVFVTNFRPRELKKFNLEYSSLKRINPKLIYGSLTGYGKKGPDKDLPGYEPTGYFSRAGIFHLLQMPGAPPPHNPFGLGDNVAGMALALGIMTALYLREKTGIGQEVEASLFSTGVFALSYDIAGSLVTGQDRQQADREEITNVLANCYQTKDGRWLRLAMNQPDLYWSKLCKAVERENIEHDPRFASFGPRMENHVALFHIMEDAFLSRTLEEWKVRLNKAGVPWAPMQSLPEVTKDPQARANDFFMPMDHPTYGRIEVVGHPISLSETPTVIRRPGPEFSQHTEEILLEYDYTWDDITKFKQQGIIA